LDPGQLKKIGLNAENFEEEPMKRLFERVLQIIEKILLPPFPVASGPAEIHDFESMYDLIACGPWFCSEMFFLGR
jgi:hypothetical protein